MNHEPFPLCVYLNPLSDDIEKRIDYLASQGIEQISTDGLEAYHVKTHAEHLATLNKYIKTHGITISACHMAGPFIDANPERSKAVLAQRFLDIDALRMLNPQKLIVHYGWVQTGSSDQHPEQMLTRLIEDMGLDAVQALHVSMLQALSDHAAGYGMSIALEGIPAIFPTGGSAVMLNEIIRDVDRPNCGICLDSGHHATWGHCIGDEIMILGNKIIETHFHDNFGPRNDPAKFARLDNHNPVGLGIINWVKVIRSLWATGFKGPVSLEGVHITSRGRPIDYEDFVRSVEISITNWRAFEELAAMRDWIAPF